MKIREKLEGKIFGNEEASFRSILRKKAKTAKRQAYSSGYLEGTRKTARKKGRQAASGKGKISVSGFLGGLGSAYGEGQKMFAGVNEANMPIGMGFGEPRRASKRKTHKPKRKPKRRTSSRRPRKVVYY